MGLSRNIETVEVKVFKAPSDISGKFIFVKLPGLSDEDCISFLETCGLRVSYKDLTKFDERMLDWVPLDITLFFLSKPENVKSAVSQLKSDCLLNKFLVIPVTFETTDECEKIWDGYLRDESVYINIETVSVKLYSLGEKHEVVANEVTLQDEYNWFMKLQKTITGALKEFGDELLSNFR